MRPSALVARAFAAGIRTLAVTDHDTVDGLSEASAAAASLGATFVNGIEITAVEDDRDVHVLGYFFEPSDPGLALFLTAQRQDRVRRVREIARRLGELGMPIDVEAVLREPGRSVGRPHIAGALVAAGYVATRDEAFARYLGRSAPAFVPRQGPDVATVVQVVRSAGGITSLAHPRLTNVDERIPEFARAGLNALEARHADHTPEQESRYRLLARRLGLEVSGGSDFHADHGHHPCALGILSLAADDLARLMARRG